MTRPATRIALVAVPLLAVAALLARPGHAQQGGPPPFRAVAGRFVPAPIGGRLAVLDAFTGRVHLAPLGEAVEGDGWVVDVEAGLRWRRPLARDVSGGQVLAQSFPVSGVGAGAPVYQWQPVGDAPGVLDTRTGAHYLLAGDPAGALRIVRTDLRLLARTVRDVPAPPG